MLVFNLTKPLTCHELLSMLLCVRGKSEENTELAVSSKDEGALRLRYPVGELEESSTPIPSPRLVMFLYIA